MKYAIILFIFFTVVKAIEINYPKICNNNIRFKINNFYFNILYYIKYNKLFKLFIFK